MWKLIAAVRNDRVELSGLRWLQRAEDQHHQHEGQHLKCRIVGQVEPPVAQISQSGSESPPRKRFVIPVVPDGPVTDRGPDDEEGLEREDDTAKQSEQLHTRQDIKARFGEQRLTIVATTELAIEPSHKIQMRANHPRDREKGGQEAIDGEADRSDNVEGAIV